MKRTPASAKRRASRHCRPKSSVFFSSIPYSFSVAAVAERGTDRDEPWEVLVLAAEAVGDPRTHARAHEVLAAGVDLEQRRAVRGIRAMQALDEAEVVDHLRHVGEELAHPSAALPVLTERPGAAQQVAGLGELHAWLGLRERLAVVPLQERLVVEGVDLRRTAMHEEEDHALGAGRRVRQPGCERSRPGWINQVRPTIGPGAAAEQLLAEQTHQRHLPEPARAGLEHGAPRDGALALAAEHGRRVVAPLRASSTERGFGADSRRA
jgi:hypothetical protein